MKPKQQKTLLSFFSPPPRPTSESKTPTPTGSAAAGTAGSSGNANQKTKEKTRADATKTTKKGGESSKKKIDFSPKPARSANGKQDDSDGEEKKKKKSKAPTQRKPHEEFLGTSSEEESSDREDKTIGAAPREAAPSVQVTPTSGFKRLRKTGVKVIEDDDDDDESDNSSDKVASNDKAGPSRRRVACGRAARKKLTRNVVSSEEEWDPAGESSDQGNADSGSEFSEKDMSDDNGDEDDEDDDDDDEEEEEEEEEERPSKRRKPAATPQSKRKSPSSALTFLSPPPSSARTPGGKKGSAMFTPPSLTKKGPSATASPSVSENAMDTSISGPNASGVYGAGCHLHDSFPWLHAKRRDINGNSPDSPDFDPRTLLVPAEFVKKETPAMMQWWQVKAQNMDTILFFKVGKFYELFHMDADVGFKELNLIYMKGEKAHSGFPEIAYGKMSSQLMEKGYRVARVEQTETPDMMKARNTKSGTKSKVVRREVCSLLSLGTNTINFLDAPISMASQEQIAKFLMVLKEETRGDATSAPGPGAPTQQFVVRFGVALVDCATGAFHLAEFDDTEQRDRIKTLFAQFYVVEVVTERHGLSADTKMVVKHAAPAAAVRSELTVGKEFWNASRTVEEIVRAGYFSEHSWPESITQFLNIDKSVREDGQLAISALGGCVWHLRRSIIDQELLSLGNFKRYRPSDEDSRTPHQDTVNGSTGTARSEAEAELKQQYVILDSQTLQNLEILKNNYDGNRSGSLIDIMDKTVTAFGKRMFQEWVLKPLCKVSEINERLDAVQELGNNQEVVMEVREYLRRLPDVERLLSRIHALGSSHRSNEHPDSRAIMYETSKYNIRKIRDFLSVLSGFEAAMDLMQELGPRFAQFDTPILRAILKKHDATNESLPSASNLRGHFPDLREKLEFFKRSFDQSQAAKSGVIVPHDGVDPEYDEACETLVEIQGELDDYLKEQRKLLSCKQIVYWGTKKEDRYQLEIPETALKVHQPKDYELKSRKKGFKRFHTAMIRDMLARLSAAEERKENALKDQMRRIFHKFDTDYKYWMKAVQCLAVLDCLLGLSLVSSQSEGFTRPQVVLAPAATSPFIDIEDGFHPCVASSFDSGGFIPNDTRLGIARTDESGDCAMEVENRARMMLLSGPNMGGKSTLLRQTCVIALMAQIGCFVPAGKCRMTPVDRVFTRIGASDRILAGQSTLFVELAETATILNHATAHSLVILDELGRGTSTFDGTAIAYSVVEYLLHQVRCRTMFATHYHSLVEEYLHDENVALGHMGCLVDPKNDRKVTFLYKLEDGMCPKSYGLNVAMLAKLPDEVIELAAAKSKQFERSLQANSHSELEALKLSRQIQECCNAETVDSKRLLELWNAAHQLVDG